MASKIDSDNEHEHQTGDNACIVDDDDDDVDEQGKAGDPTTEESKSKKKRKKKKKNKGIRIYFDGCRQNLLHRCYHYLIATGDITDDKTVEALSNLTVHVDGKLVNQSIRTSSIV
jgi:hypothetical protein